MFEKKLDQLISQCKEFIAINNPYWLTSYYHGPDHSDRCVFLSVEYYKYYHKLLAFDFELIDLIIPVYFHDSGRQGEGLDVWEEQSRDLCADFLLSSGYETARASYISSIITLKDAHQSYMGKILHDVDCLEYLRLIAPSQFERSRLKMPICKELCHFERESATEFTTSLISKLVEMQEAAIYERINHFTR